MPGLDPREQALAYFRVEAGEFGLDAGAQAPWRVLNWGGFVSHLTTSGTAGDRSTRRSRATPTGCVAGSRPRR
jgi:hypothetical protein